MPLLRTQKEELVAKLTKELQNSRVALVFAYTGLNMSANDSLRTKTFAAGARVKMISNNLLRLILKNINRELEIPEKTLALAYGFADEVVAAKTLVEFAKETETLEVLGGWIDGNFFDEEQVKTLALLPGKSALQAQLVGRLGGLIGSLAYSLNYPIQKFAYVIDAVKSAQSVTAEENPPVGKELKVEEKIEEPVVETAAETVATPTDSSTEASASEEGSTSGSDNTPAESNEGAGAPEEEENSEEASEGEKGDS